MRQLSVISAMLICSYLQAQIVINSTDMPAVGDTFQTKRDTIAFGFDIGMAGPDRIWNFENLNGHIPTTIYAVSPASTPYAADFPNATYAITSDLSGYFFYNNTGTALKWEGYSTNDINLGAISVNFIPPPDQYQFPASYLTNFSGSSRFKESKNYNQLSPAIQHLIDSLLAGVPGVSVNSIEVSDTTVYKDTIDAWGKVITPIGTYDALRNKRIETGTTWIIANLQSLFGQIPYTIARIPKNTTEHSWLSPITKIPLVSLTYDTSRIVTAVTYSTMPPPPVADFTWDNPSGGTVNFADASQNSPETYDWDFGDGNVSNLQSPSHDYAANGSYYVCLTVTNVSGNDTFCDSVTVSGMSSSVQVSGRILSELNAKIRNTTVDATGSSPQNMMTDTSGSYSFTFNTGDSATITPFKSNDTTNGITTLDIIFIQKQILVIEPLPLNTPYKLIAADVNGSKTVTTIDIVFIRAVILRVQPTFPGGKIWSFIPSDYLNPDTPYVFPSSRTYENLTSDQTDQDFIGIKLGDVNNSWNPALAKTDAVGDVHFVMDKHDVIPGQEITIPVRVKDFKNVTGYQFTLSWDPEVLALLDVKNRSLNGYYGTEKISEGYLTTSWNDELVRDISMDDDQTVFELKFKVTGTAGTSSEIKIGSEMTVGEAYNENLDLLQVKSISGMVKVGESSSIINHQSSIINLSVQPNPFTNTTSINFEISKDEMISIAIYDLYGKQVKLIKANYSAGQHSITWNGGTDAGEGLSSGLYHVRLTAKDCTISEKLIRIQ